MRFPFPSSVLSLVIAHHSGLSAKQWIIPVPPTELDGTTDGLKGFRGQMAERLGSRTINQKVFGWIPGRAK